MEIVFASRKVQRACNSEKEMRKAYGVLAAAKLKQRLAELSAADSLADLRTLPAVRCHELDGDRTGQLSVSVTGGRRLVLEPDHVPWPCKGDGGLDWSRVTRIRIIEVVDYH